MLGRKTARRVADRYVTEPLRRAADLAGLAFCLALIALAVALYRFG